MTKGSLFKRILLVLAVLLVLAFFILWRLPPERLLERALPPEISWSSVDGSVFDASVNQLTLDQHVIEQLDWKINPLTLLTGVPQISLIGTDSRISFTADVSHNIWVSGTEINDVIGQADASWIQYFINQPGLILSGTLDFELNQIGFSETGRLNAISGVANWNDASVQITSRVDLGSVLTEWQTTDGIVFAKIRDQGGVLEIDGTVRFEEDSYRIELDLKPRYASQDLERALALFSKPDASGVTQVRISGPLLSLFGH